MFAKNLETLLSELCQKSDVSRSRRHEFAERFDALRGCGLLPRGRENRAKLLTNRKIAAAILVWHLQNPAGRATRQSYSQNCDQ